MPTFVYIQGKDKGMMDTSQNSHTQHTAATAVLNDSFNTTSNHHITSTEVHEHEQDVHFIFASDSSDTSSVSSVSVRDLLHQKIFGYNANSDDDIPVGLVDGHKSVPRGNDNTEGIKEFTIPPLTPIDNTRSCNSVADSIQGKIHGKRGEHKPAAAAQATTTTMDATRTSPKEITVSTSPSRGNSHRKISPHLPSATAAAVGAKNTYATSTKARMSLENSRQGSSRRLLERPAPPIPGSSKSGGDVINKVPTSLERRTDWLHPDNYCTSSSPTVLERPLRWGGETTTAAPPPHSKERQQQLQRMNEIGHDWFPAPTSSPPSASAVGRPPRSPPPNNNNSDQRGDLIQIYPGVYVPLRTAYETETAIARDFYTSTTCLGCERDIFCIRDASYMICPCCKFVSSMEDHSNGNDDSQKRKRGLGIGFTGKTLLDTKERVRGIRFRL